MAGTQTAQYHTLSGGTYGKSKNLLQQMEDDRNHKHHVHNPYYPFSGAAEWTLAKFLAENLTQAQVNRFLKLHWVLSLIMFVTMLLIMINCCSSVKMQNRPSHQPSSC